MCRPVGVFWAEAFPGGHIGPPLRGGGGVPNQRKIGAKTGPFQRGGTEPAPYRGRSRAVRPGTAGCSYPALRKRHRWCTAVGRCRHRPLRPAGGRGTARRVVVPYGWLRRAAAIALGSGAQRSVCGADGRNGWKSEQRSPPKCLSTPDNPSGTAFGRASSLYTREPLGRGMRIAASLRSSQ